MHVYGERTNECKTYKLLYLLFIKLQISLNANCFVGGHERRQRGAGEPCPPWIFKHGTNIVGRKRLKSAIFGLFCYFLVFFPLPPSRKRVNCPPPSWKFSLRFRRDSKPNSLKFNFSDCNKKPRFFKHLIYQRRFWISILVPLSANRAYRGWLKQEL